MSQPLPHHNAQHVLQPHCPTSTHAQARWPNSICHVMTTIARQRRLEEPPPHPASHETSHNGSGESTGAYPLPKAPNCNEQDNYNAPFTQRENLVFICTLPLLWGKCSSLLTASSNTRRRSQAVQRGFVSVIKQW